jgi:hypothetical protein
MMSVIIPVLRDDPALVDTLAALVPAAAEGIVRDVVLGTTDETPFVQELADAAGCGIVTQPGDRSALVRAAVRRVKGPWLLLLEPGLAPGGDWMADAADFIDEAGRDVTLAAVFTLASRGGAGPRARAFLRNAATSLFGRTDPLQGLVAHREGWEAGRLRISRLPSPIHDRRHENRHARGRSARPGGR